MLDGAAFETIGPERFAAVVAAGVDWVQLRERERSGAALLALADDLVRTVRVGAERAGRRAWVLVNRRLDVALASGADGVHLGFDALPATRARELLGETPLVGVSCHAPEEVSAAMGASYAHLAPVFPPLSKVSERPPLGPAALGRAREAGIPVLAQGGVTAENAARCLRAGAAGVAVSGTILGSAAPDSAAAGLRRALDGAD